MTAELVLMNEEDRQKFTRVRRYTIPDTCDAVARNYTLDWAKVGTMDKSLVDDIVRFQLEPTGQKRLLQTSHNNVIGSFKKLDDTYRRHFETFANLDSTFRSLGYADRDQLISWNAGLQECRYPILLGALP